MKLFFTLLTLAVAAMWIGATVTLPPDVIDGRTVLTWSTDANPARSQQLAPFRENNPDLLVEVEPNTFDRTIIQCSTGVGPDIIEIYSTEDMVAYVEAGILLDLTPYAEEMGFGPDSTWQRLVGNLMFEGKQYRYPANAASQVLIYNKRMFDEAGVPYPEDGMLWEDFIELIQPLTKRDENGRFTQFALLIPEGYVRDLLLQYGASFFNESLTECVLDSEAAVAALEFYDYLMHDIQLVPTPSAADALSTAGGWGYGEIRWFASQKAACIWGSRWMFVIFRQYPELHEHLGVALLPHPPGGSSASYSGTRGPGINANSERIDESLRFLQYLASEEYAGVIARSADGLPPLADYARDVENLVNPDYPEEDFQEKFITSMELARPTRVSPFVSPFVVQQRWTDALDNIKSDILEPREALERATTQINALIERNIRERPDLREKYEATLE